MKGRAALWVVAATLALAAMLSRAEVRVVDDTGAVITLATPAQRIVSLAPHATELLIAAGAGSRIVGTVAAWNGAPDARGIPNVGDARTLDLERIVALAPDLIVTWPYTVAAQVETLAARGAAVFVTNPITIDGIATDIERLGTLAGTETQAQAAAAGFRERVARLRARHPAAPPIRVFYQVWNAPMYTIGGRHLVSEAIRVCGGENIFAALALPAPGVSVEAVLAAQPWAIIAGGDGGSRPAWLDDWKRWTTVPAVANGALFTVNADLLHRPGPRFVDGVEELCAALDKARRKAR